MRFSALPLSSALLLALSVLTVSGDGASPLVAAGSPLRSDSAQSPSLAVKVSTIFPASEAVFGVKAINKRPTTAFLSIQNNETTPITLTAIGGSLWTMPPASTLTTELSTSRNLVNLTTAKHRVLVPAGEVARVEYKFQTDFHPQELRLQLLAAFSTPPRDAAGKGPASFFTLTAFNETISVVEPDSSLFDPQVLFLYLIMISGFAGTAYFVYSRFLEQMFPQRRRETRRGGQRVDKTGVAGTDGLSTGIASGYDENWIPDHHKRPGATRARSGTPKGRN